MTSIVRAGAIVLALLGVVQPVDAGGAWSSVVIDEEAEPTENRLAVLGHGAESPDLLIVTLYPLGPPQQFAVGAYVVPPPYDGSGVAFEEEVDTGVIFDVGDVCVLGENHALVPYVKNPGGGETLMVAELTGGSWSVAPVMGQPGGVYHSGDCFLTGDGVFLMTVNNSARAVEFYRRDLPASSAAEGSTFTLAGVLASPDLPQPPLSPLVGGPSAFAESGMSVFVPGSSTDEFLTGFGVGADAGAEGPLLIGTSTTSDIAGGFEGRVFGVATEQQDGALPSRFFASTEGAGTGRVGWVASQHETVLTLRRFGLDEQADDEVTPIGDIDQGKIHTFVGLDAAMAPDGFLYLVVDQSYRVDPSTSAADPIAGYPFELLAGPVQIAFPPGMFRGLAVGPGKAAGLELGLLDIDVVFADGFETGDSSVWGSSVGD